jgi:hypothetical protein
MTQPNRHDKLFDDYLAEMHRSREFALAWWSDLMVTEIRASDSPERARHSLEMRWPFGPASHPRVLATYRRFWFLNEALNAQIETEREAERGGSSRVDETQDSGWGRDDSPTGEDESESIVDGWVLLIDMLYGRDDVLAQFLEAMVFQPIGTHADTGRFV